MSITFQVQCSVIERSQKKNGQANEQPHRPKQHSNGKAYISMVSG